MTRSLRLAALVLATVLGSAWPVQGGILDILEELSGPGPFGARGNVLFSGLCHKVRAGDRTYSTQRHFGIPGKVDVIPPPPPNEKRPDIPSYMPCFFADFRILQSIPKDNFPNKTNATTAEFGITFPLVRPIEIGAGAGWIRFRTVGISTHRVTFTPLRVVIKPLFFIPQHQERDRLAFLKYYIKETIIFGKLRGDNFGVSNKVFENRTTADYVTSAGFVIDVGELISR